MIERASEFGASASAPLSQGDTREMTAGDILRQAREGHGLHLEVVAAALKVPPYKLQALEDDDFEALPDPVFARALAASVSRALRIDPAPVLAKLPGANVIGLAEADRVVSRTIRSKLDRPGRGGGGGLSRPVVVGAILLLLGAAALFWLPQSVFDGLGASVARWTSQESAVQASAPAEAEPNTAGVAVETVTPAVPAAQDPEPAPADAQAPPAESAPASADLLVFTVQSTSWIRVGEAGGKVLMQREVAAGERVALSGELPLSVVVGRASGVEVQVRGQAFDLVPFTKAGGVARFEVRP